MSINSNHCTKSASSNTQQPNNQDVLKYKHLSNLANWGWSWLAAIANIFSRLLGFSQTPSPKGDASHSQLINSAPLSSKKPPLPSERLVQFYENQPNDQGVTFQSLFSKNDQFLEDNHV